MKKTLLILAVMLMGLGVMAQSTYTKVTSESELNAGDKVLLVGIDDNGQAWAMSYQKTNNRKALAVTMDGDAIVATVATDPSSQSEPFEITIGGQTGAWTFFDELGNGYLYAPGGGNYLKTQANNDDKGEWTLSMDGDGFVPTSNGGVEQNIMRYNPNTQNNDPLFGCYKPSSTVSGLVYIFKAGSAVVNPEPSNYPTNFTAEVDGLNVILSWEDATGAQLPNKYLVLASTGNIIVPTDGTPVANDVLAMNVNYGVQTVTFSGLESGVTYHFAIFPYTNGGANIDYKTDGTYPTATATTEEFFLMEDFNDELGQFTAVSVTGDQVWHQGTYQGKTYANMNGYANQANNENEDWLISPQLTLGADLIYYSLKLEFSTAMKFDGNPLQVMISNNYNGQENPNDATWIEITDAFDFSQGNYEWVESGAVDILNLVPDQFYVAFRYTSTSQAASSWEIDYVKIIADYQVSVNENASSVFNVYPNPAHEVVSFNLTGDAQVSIFDITGRMVNTMDMAAGQGQCQVSNLENGVYFLNIRYTDGKTEVARFVKF